MIGRINAWRLALADGRLGKTLAYANSLTTYHAIQAYRNHNIQVHGIVDHDSEGKFRERQEEDGFPSYFSAGK